MRMQGQASVEITVLLGATILLFLMLALMAGQSDAETERLALALDAKRECLLVAAELESLLRLGDGATSQISVTQPFEARNGTVFVNATSCSTATTVTLNASQGTVRFSNKGGRIVIA